MRTYKRKLILNVAQKNRLRSWIGASRVVYNLAKEISDMHYVVTGKTMHKYDLMKQLSPLRQDFEWINDVPFTSLQSSIDKLSSSYALFFKTYKIGGRPPMFASKKKFNSIKFKFFKVSNGCILIPKIGKVKTFKDEPILGTPKTATIKIEPTGFFITIVCDNVPPKFESENQAIGLDMGIAQFCTDSNGGFIANPKHFKKYERKLRIENRSLARKKKGGNSWKKQCKKLALLHHTIGNVRKDFLHKESTKIAKENSIVYMEDLNVKGMVKSNLSKHILDCGWGEFRTMLSYKTKVIAINPAYTSQTCNECGARDKVSRVSQSEFACTSCGHIAHADINAAKNIKSKGIALDRQREALACA